MALYASNHVFVGGLKPSTKSDVNRVAEKKWINHLSMHLFETQIYGKNETTTLQENVNFT